MLTFFTLQPDYVNIANLPMPGAIAIVLALMVFGGAAGRVFGILSIGDLVKAVIEEQTAQIEQLERYIAG